jgi:L-malate glycosyltransferase
MQPVKRILIIQTQGENAGAQEISRLISNELDARGYHITNLFFYRKSASFDAPINTRYCTVDRPRGLLGALTFPWQLLREIRAARPQAILTFQHYGNTVGGVAARLVSPASVIANQVSGAVHMNLAVRTADFLLGIIGAFNLITVNSQGMLQEYGRYPSPYSRRLRYIPHGFDLKSSVLTKPQARAAFGLPEAATLLGSVARLNAGKRLDAAIRTLPDHPDWHLALAGQGPHEADLRQLAAALGVQQRVHFAGEMPPERIGDFLAALDVFVFPTRGETFGLAAVEAASAGVPVVAHDLAVLREVLAADERPAALFADAADDRAFADAIARALSDLQLRDDLIAAGRGLRTRYSVARMVDDYERLLGELAPTAVRLAPQS